MSEKILVISTSLREGNSEILADAFIKGARDAKHVVEKINLSNKNIGFCKGCLACQTMKKGNCVIQDDANLIINKMKEAKIIVFATPIYFYEMSGQMKTLLDRSNPLFPISYKFRDIYLIASAAERDTSAMDGAINGLKGWIECFEEASLKGVIYGIGADDTNAILNFPDIIEEAYDMGRNA